MGIFDVRFRPFVGSLLPGLVFAALFTVVFPPFDVWWLVFLAPLPLMAVGLLSGSLWRSGIGVSLAAIPAWWVHQSWVAEISVAGLPLMLVYLSLWAGLFVIAFGYIVRRVGWLPCWVAGPIVWIGLEVARGEIAWDGYPWYLLAHPTIEWAGLASLASLVGVYGVGLVVTLPAALSLDVIRYRTDKRGDSTEPSTRCRASLVAGAVLAVVLFGWAASPLSPDAFRVRASEAAAEVEPVQFALIQTSLPQSNKVWWGIEDRIRDLEAFLKMTKLAVESRPKPDVVVWPETMFPGYTLSPAAVKLEQEAGIVIPDLDNFPVTRFHDRLVETQRELGVPMIVGAIGVDGLELRFEDGVEYVPAAMFNSAFVIHDGYVDDMRYDKIHLTPFGEVMPYISAWPWLERLLLDIGAGGMSFGLDSGREAVRLEVMVDGEKLPVATPICFEVSNSGVCRRLVFERGERRARVLVQLTNDGWFGRSRGGRAVHLQIARWRCVELGTPLVRAANTGLSAAIDARGRFIRRQVDPFEPGVGIEDGSSPAGILTAQIIPARMTDVTIYARLGNVLGWAAMLATIGGLILAAFAGRRDRGGVEPESAV